MWPESVAAGDFEGFEDEAVSVVEDSVSPGMSMALEGDDDDVEAPSTELSSKELPDVQTEQQQTAAEGLSSEEGEGREDIQGNAFGKQTLGQGF